MKRAIPFIFWLAVALAVFRYFYGAFNRHAAPVLTQTNVETIGPCISVRYAVAPCGIWSMRDMVAAMKDAEVRAHYQGFGTDIHMIHTTDATMKHASFRDAKGIAWTAAKIPIPKGDCHMVDKNGNELRCRCGNRLEDELKPGDRVMPAPPTLDRDVPTSVVPEEVPYLPPVPLERVLFPTSPLVAFVPPVDVLPISPGPSWIPPIVAAASVPPELFLYPPVVGRAPVGRGTPEPGTMWLGALWLLIFVYMRRLR